MFPLSRATQGRIALPDGRTLAYAEYGNPRGEPIVHCHGAPSSRVEADLTIGADTAAELGVRVIVPDRPGMGLSDFQPGRRILDWPSDVLAVATALGLDTFAVVGASGGAPYALACAVQIPKRIRAVGLVGGIAPLDAPGTAAAMSRPLRAMFSMARFAPFVLSALFRLNLRAMSGSSNRGSERMAASFPEPDRTLMQRPEIRDGFVACFKEACRRGPQGPVWDMKLLARPWGIDLGSIDVPVWLWQGERDRNVPSAHGRYLASAIPTCRATFYPEEAHLSLAINRRREILSALAR